MKPGAAGWQMATGLRPCQVPGEWTDHRVVRQLRGNPQNKSYQSHSTGATEAASSSNVTPMLTRVFCTSATASRRTTASVLAPLARLYAQHTACTFPATYPRLLSTRSSDAAHGPLGSNAIPVLAHLPQTSASAIQASVRSNATSFTSALDLARMNRFVARYSKLVFSARAALSRLRSASSSRFSCRRRALRLLASSLLRVL